MSKDMYVALCQSVYSAIAATLRNHLQIADGLESRRKLFLFFAGTPVVEHEGTVTL